MEINQVIYYIQKIGKILSIGISLYAILWSLISVVKVFVEKMHMAIENKDWEQMIEIVNEFVLAAEQKFLDEKGSGKKKKEEVINLLESYGYEVTDIVDALIESVVYQQFNADKEK